MQVSVLLPANGHEFDRAARLAESGIRRAFPDGGTRIGSIAAPVVFGWYRPSKRSRKLEWDRTLMITVALDIPDGDPEHLMELLVAILDEAYCEEETWQDTYSISVVEGYFRFPRGRRPRPAE